jgi:hypothetical protein
VLPLPCSACVCVRVLPPNGTGRADGWADDVQDGSGSWEDPYTGTFCIENTDEHGHTCSQYVAAGYTCAMMISEYNYDCRCACE